MLEIDISYPNGQTLKIDWKLVSFVEFQKAVELRKSLEIDFPAPFVLGENGKSETVDSREELLVKVMAMAKKDLSIQRYKGLGEMNPEKLWETMMDPEKRTMLQVRIEDAIKPTAYSPSSRATTSNPAARSSKTTRRQKSRCISGNQL